MNTIKVAILGLGTVGTGVYKLIQKRADVMERTAGAKLEVKKILVRNMQKKREGVEQELLTDNWKEILEDDEISVVIEVMGGLEPAKTMILEALEAGKNVVSANKDLIAEEGHVLLDTAQKNQVDFLFEAAVAGGIPIIRPLKQCLAANDISEIVGIVNGTTNYILTKMTEEGMDFADALKKAQELGFAEADPTADVEGLDAGRKVAIMASIAFHSRVVFFNVHTEGITKITARDIAYAKEFDSVIKLLGVARNEADGIEAYVCPMLIPSSHPLATVNDSYNAVFVHGDAVEDAMFFGRGAGELPTASAVVADVVDMARHQHTNIYIDWKPEKLTLVSYDDSVNRFFVRTDSPKEEVEKIFGNVSYVENVVDGEYGFTTEAMAEKDFAAKADKINVINRIRL